MDEVREIDRLIRIISDKARVARRGTVIATIGEEDATRRLPQGRRVDYGHTNRLCKKRIAVPTNRPGLRSYSRNNNP